MTAARPEVNCCLAIALGLGCDQRAVASLGDRA